MFRSVILCCAVALSACESQLVLMPSGPPENGAPGNRLEINGSATLRTEQAEVFAAIISLANGTSGPAPRPIWTSSDERVASVSEAGVVNAKQQGSATISASAFGLAGEKRVQVWQNYHGTWMGTYVVRACAQDGLFAPGWCSTFPAGTSVPFVLTLIQNEAAASGTFTLGSFQGPIQGDISTDLRFVGTASLSALISGVLYSSTVGDFNFVVDGDVRAGNLALETTSTGLAGAGHLEAGLASVTRTSFTAP